MSHTSRLSYTVCGGPPDHKETHEALSNKTPPCPASKCPKINNPPSLTGNLSHGAGSPTEMSPTVRVKTPTSSRSIDGSTKPRTTRHTTISGLLNRRQQRTEPARVWVGSRTVTWVVGNIGVRCDCSYKSFFIPIVLVYPNSFSNPCPCSRPGRHVVLLVVCVLHLLGV